MSTLVNQAVTAIMAALNSGTPVCSRIDRVRLRPQASATALAVVVRPLQSQVTEAAVFDQMPISWQTVIAVECYARATPGTSPDVAVDALLDSVFARLMADATLGGVVLGMQPQEISYDFDADADQTACAILVFHVRQRSPGLSLS